MTGVRSQIRDCAAFLELLDSTTLNLRDLETRWTCGLGSYLFDASDGTLRSIASAANDTGFRFHDMRHSTASIMAAGGERPEIIQRVLRHAKVSFTLDRYVKVYRDDIRDAA